MIKPNTSHWFLLLFLVGLFSAGSLQASTPWWAKNKAIANRSLQLNNGPAFMGFKDEVQSPRAYLGKGWGMGVGYERIQLKKIYSTEIQFYSGMVTNQQSSRLGLNVADCYGFQANSARLWRVKAALGRLQWYAGYGTQAYMQIRDNAALENGSLGYDAMLGLGGVSRLEFPFRLKSDKTYRFWIFKYTRAAYRPIRIGWQLELPVVAAHLRTPYIGLHNTLGNDPNAGIRQDLKENLNVTLAGNYLYLKNQLYAHYFLKNGNALSLQWQWTGYAYEQNNQATRSANSQLLVGLRIKLDTHPEQRR